MSHDPPRLALLTPPVDDAEAFRPRLEEACAAAEIAAVILTLAPADERTLVNRLKRLAPLAQATGAAVLVAGSDEDGPAALDIVTVAMRGGADGVHTARPERARDLRARLGPERSLGVGGLRSKHDAMEAGEAGVDYVLFGEPRPDGSLPAFDLVLERAGWWAEIFQPPCLAYAPALDDLPALAATGAEFVALGEAVWAHPEGPAAAIRRAAALLARHPEAVA